MAMAADQEVRPTFLDTTLAARRRSRFGQNAQKRVRNMLILRWSRSANLGKMPKLNLGAFRGKPRAGWPSRPIAAARA